MNEYTRFIGGKQWRINVESVQSNISVKEKIVSKLNLVKQKITGR